MADQNSNKSPYNQYEWPGDPSNIHAEEDAAEEEQAKRLQDSWEDAQQQEEPEHENQIGGGYKHGNKKGKKGFQRLRDLRKRQKLLLAGGGIVGFLAAMILMLFGFLNVFKLDNLISNVDAQTFARLHGVADRRSYAWMQAYMTMRLADMSENPDLDKGADSDNIFFRSEKVRKNPLTDWYKTLRSSKFEQEVFEKRGFKFVSVYDKKTGRIRPGKIILNDKTLQTVNVSNADWDGLARGDTATIRKYAHLVDIETFDNDKQARKAIRKMLDTELRSWDVLQRRHIRKDIQHMTGVRDWRFFEKTRNHIDEKKIDIRNKLIRKAIPESTKAGKFVRCLFGMTECRLSNDPRDPEYASDQALVGDDNPDKKNDPVQTQDKNGKVTANPDYVPAKEASDLVKKIIASAAPALGPVNFVSTMDTISNISKSIHNHSLSKGVAIARGTQTEGLFQTLKTARDQIKTGEQTGAEVNALMKTLGPVAHSEGFTKVISGKGNSKSFPNTPERKKYCSKENQAKIENNPVEGNKQFAWICPNMRIGGASTALELENAWNSSIGAVVDPIMGIYGPIRHAPVIGAVFDAVNSIFNKASEILIGALKGILAAVGLKDDLEHAIVWLISKVGEFLGAVPILSPNYSAPVLFNWLVQGGAFTAESSSRSQGAAKTTNDSRVATQEVLAQYTKDSEDDKSVFDKYLSLSQYDSVASKQAFALSQLNFSDIANKLGNFGSLIKPLSSALSLPFSHQTQALNDNGYAGSNVAGIDTFDFPKECLNYDILNATPQNGTNIQKILGKDKVPDDELTWELVGDKDKWYEYVYEKIGERDNADDIAVKIWNCNLNERVVRGAIGNLYGYSDDGGLDDAQTPTTASGAVCPDRAAGKCRPYDDASPWNTPIPQNVQVLSNSATFVRAITDNNKPLTSDFTQYSITVYLFKDSSPTRNVSVGAFSAYDKGDYSRVKIFSPVKNVPLPEGAKSGAGSDGQIILWNPISGVQYEFWQLKGNSASHGLRYNTGPGNYGRFGDGKAGRGGGTPYFAGLVRSWELIEQGSIEHALAFAYQSPSHGIVYPAGKSDGGGKTGTDAPEGTRFQLDPSLDVSSIAGCNKECQIVAKALQKYGMYVIDNSGSSKVYLEDSITAKWPSSVNRNFLNKIPLSKFRAVAAPAKVGK